MQEKGMLINARYTNLLLCLLSENKNKINMEKTLFNYIWSSKNISSNETFQCYVMVLNCIYNWNEQEYNMKKP